MNLVRTSKVHIEQDGLFAYSNLTWSGAHADGVVHAKADIINGGGSAASVCVNFQIIDDEGKVVATKASTAPVSVPAMSGTHAASAPAEAVLQVPAPKLWSSSTTSVK